VIALLIQEKDISEAILRGQKYDELARHDINPYQTETETLSRAMHHWVKNNLQLIGSLINMSARAVSDQETKQILKENVARVLSIASVHDIMTTTAHCTCHALCKKLCAGIESLIPSEQAIVFTVSGDDFPLESEQVTAIAIVINELLTNAIKHAFTGCDSGRINIDVQSGNAFYVMSVEDNGVGIPDGKACNKGFGLEIVTSLVHEKLKGEFRIRSGSDGTTAMFDIRK
jgi:two-component sensor histidine kinase